MIEINDVLGTERPEIWFFDFYGYAYMFPVFFPLIGTGLPSWTV